MQADSTMTAALFHRFRSHAGPRLAWALILLIAVSALEAAGLVTLMPIIEQLGLGSVQLGGRIGNGWRTLFLWAGAKPSFEVLLAGFAALLMIQSILKRLSDRLNSELEAGFTTRLRTDLYTALMQSNWLSFTRLKTAEVTRTLTQDVDHAGLAAQQGLVLMSLVALALIHGSMALICSVPLTLLAIASGVVVALAMRPFNRRSHRAAVTGQALRRELNHSISEHLSGFKVAKSHGRGKQHGEIFLRSAAKLAEHQVRSRQLSGVSRSVFEISGWLALMVFLLAAVRWAQVGTGQLVLMVFIFTRLLPRIGAIQSSWQQILNHLPAYAATQSLLEKLMAAQELIPSSGSRIELQQALSLNRVTFAYDPEGSRRAVHQLSLSVPARQMTAVVGSSGSGKSTLADLMLGLLTPAEGTISVDGRLLNGAVLAEWRNSIGYVPQEPFLFHDTVRANLLWSNPEATEDELRAVLKTAAADAFVERLPQGLDTVVGDRGVRLSGGERQRLTLARALLRRPTLLLLDEATSSLDTANERFVQEAIDRLHGELTLVVIAHRLSTVQQADQVVVLDHGHVVESGTPTELSRREGGAYRRLMQASASQPS
jgi:ATP-binding cassette subfamily C protein